VPKSRTERPRKTKIGIEVAHITRDSDTTFKVKGQGHRAALLTAVLVREAAAAMGVRILLRCHLLSRERRFGANGGRGEQRVHIVAAAHLQLVYINSVRGANRLWGESSVGETSMGRNAHGAKRLWGEMSFHGAKCPWGEMSVGRKVHKPRLRSQHCYNSDVSLLCVTLFFSGLKI